MTITLKIPTKVGGERAPILVKQGRRSLGPLCNKPEVKGGKLIAGPIILVARDPAVVCKHPGAGIEPHFFENGLGTLCLEVRYGREFATYRLIPDQVVYSDGPPHPNHLQLALRIALTDGIAEPEGT